MKRTGLNSVRLEFLYCPLWTEELGPLDNLYLFIALLLVWGTQLVILFFSAVKKIQIVTLKTCALFMTTPQRACSLMWNRNNFSTIGLGELFSQPKQRKIFEYWIWRHGAYQDLLLCLWSNSTRKGCIDEQFTDYNNLLLTQLLLIMRHC